MLNVLEMQLKWMLRKRDRKMKVEVTWKNADGQMFQSERLFVEREREREIAGMREIKWQERESKKVSKRES